MAEPVEPKSNEIDAESLSRLLELELIQKRATWKQSGERYRSGEHLLLFFYSPSKLGLTSPVGGSLGRFAVDSAGNVIFDNAGLAGPFPSHALSDRALTNHALADQGLRNRISLDPTSRAKLAGQNVDGKAVSDLVRQKLGGA